MLVLIGPEFRPTNLQYWQTYGHKMNNCIYYTGLLMIIGLTALNESLVIESFIPTYISFSVLHLLQSVCLFRLIFSLWKVRQNRVKSMDPPNSS